ETQAGLASSAMTVPIAVTVLPVSAFGSESATSAAALTSAIEAALVRSGLRVFRAPDSASQRVLVESSLQRSGSRVRAQVRVSGPSPSDPLWSDQVDFRA